MEGVVIISIYENKPGEIETVITLSKDVSEEQLCAATASLAERVAGELQVNNRAVADLLVEIIEEDRPISEEKKYIDSIEIVPAPRPDDL